MVRVSILGMGPGSPDLLTLAGMKALEGADLVIGAARLLEGLPAGRPGRELVAATRSDEIAGRIRAAQAGGRPGQAGGPGQEGCPGQECDSWQEGRPQEGRLGQEDSPGSEGPSDEGDGTGRDLNVVVVMSGDIGLFSGAKSLIGRLADEGISDMQVVPGVSSVQYLAAQLGRPWQSWHCVSAHGVACDPAVELAGRREVFFVTGGKNTVSSLCRTLCDAGFGGCAVTVGERLSYDDESLRSGSVREFASQDFNELSVMLVENERPMPQTSGKEGVIYPGLGMPSATGEEPTAQAGGSPPQDPAEPAAAREEPTGSGSLVQGWRWAQTGIPDSCFKRARVPMTKQEVRAVMLSKLMVAEDDVIYDIGSGSGSVAVELGLLAKRGRVYAVEHKPEAAALTRANLARFGLEEVVVVEGPAPEALEGLPVPDAAFIGGSSGRLEELLASLTNKNAAVRICIACVSIETLEQACRLLSGDGYSGFEVCQVGVARSEAVGSHTLLKALNPIFLVSAAGSGASASAGGGASHASADSVEGRV